MWQIEKPDPKPRERHELAHGPFHLTVSVEKDGRSWQSLLLSFGEFSGRELEECLKSWPREAIARARAVLDKFEASLSEGEGNEANLEGRETVRGTAQA